MKNLKFLAISLFTVALVSCGGDKKTDSVTTTDTSATAASTPAESADAAKYDPNRGIGKHENIDVSKFDPAMASAGEKVAEVKCFSCHKTTEEKLVGPGWSGVTSRHQPEWIMNFITNTDAMITKDPKMQAALEICLVRMPNQNLADEDARNLLEFMRKNDGVK